MTRESMICNLLVNYDIQNVLHTFLSLNTAITWTFLCLEKQSSDGFEFWHAHPELFTIL